MEQNEQNPMTGTPTNGDAPNKEGSVGAMIGSIIIILIIIIGGVYVLNMVKNSRPDNNIPTDNATVEADSTNSVADIEKELNSDDLNNLDAELDSIDAEFN